MTLINLSEMLSKEEKFAKAKNLGYLIDLKNKDAYHESIKKNKSSKPDSNSWKDKRVLITGVAGFVGSHLAEKLLSYGAKPYGIVKKHATPFYFNIDHILKSFKVFTLDMTELEALEEVVKKTDPHIIFHLASESFVPTSVSEPKRVFYNNAESTYNVFIAARKYAQSLEALHVACSSEQYGYIKGLSEIPIKENNILRPLSSYAVSKVATEYIAKMYNEVYGIPSIITRAFNHEGPRRGYKFFTAVVAREVAKCLLNSDNKIIIGNPNSIRDITHVYDMVEAYLLAAEKVERGEPYNVCTGKGITTGDYVQLAMETFDLQNKAQILVDTERLRVHERNLGLFDGFVGDYAKFNKKTGWNPTLSLIDLIRDHVNFYLDNKNLINIEV